MHFVNPYQKSPATEWERQVDELYMLYATSPDVAVRDQAILDVAEDLGRRQPAFHLVNDRRSSPSAATTRSTAWPSPGGRSTRSCNGRSSKTSVCGDWFLVERKRTAS